jgi:hypothetical protein
VFIAYMDIIMHAYTERILKRSRHATKHISMTPLVKGPQSRLAHTSNISPNSKQFWKWVWGMV